ncbi:response regulator [Aquibacillus albus]|uniref:DNA-binding response OmpR family regulator n=1 Tax=Aquibacillus albus TaxID=1168171 RepID=A0ABS2N5Q2_9BACI|nr:response regulator transcription factor [Aquibacillus albus]MBM7573436.1 DNA-binding response OmpR family regulator [Aquibacillus albus]
MSERKIMIVDDEIEIIEMVKLFLERENYELITLNFGDEVLDKVKDVKPDLLILDILLPGIDGIEICQSLRKFTDIPIIFISCKAEDVDKVVGLSAGGDDYMTKPFSPIELVARVKAHLRRSSTLKTAQINAVITRGSLEMNRFTQRVFVHGREVHLSSREFKLLHQLAQHPGRIYSLAELYELVWGIDSISDTRTVMVHISNLRKKLEDVQAANTADRSKNAPYIVTIRGAGYKFNEDQLG